jgi:alkyl sulfatase BDS1-like metallo-beta-lactamase superfamily hydrolase
MKLGNLIAGAAVSLMLAGGALAADIEHFHPKGKPPSKHTIEIIEKARAAMPFSDTQDFDEQKKGVHRSA